MELVEILWIIGLVWLAVQPRSASSLCEHSNVLSY